MRRLFLQIIVLFASTAVICADDFDQFTINSNQVASVQQKLSAYEKGQLDLDSLRQNKELTRELVGFYLQNSNNTSTKAKLPIAIALSKFGLFSASLPLAMEYTKTYSNDWHGWRCLGADYTLLNSNTNALEAYREALKLGDPDSYDAVAGLALKCNRADIVRPLIPKLFELKEAKATSEEDKLNYVSILLSYSLVSASQDVFLRSLKEINMEEILSRQDITHDVRNGCDDFRGQSTEIGKLCKEFEAAQAKGPSTNTVENPGK